ncbi:eukaryotic translation initiation factor-like [Zingiber officinale]|uniref:eukaryotic translation initiation factor-like n=1 Tax=Zingiber officinale TaxID=94328 RepID=UPI001C4AC129|nr:eukaryotic translation initiation factor-like [Zingiber officinale]
MANLSTMVAPWENSTRLMVLGLICKTLLESLGGESSGLDDCAPKWEDLECTNGGKWSFVCTSKASLDNVWLETLTSLIREQFHKSEEICGVVASVLQRQDRLALWTKAANNEAVQMSMGRKWKEIIDFKDKIAYSFHLHTLTTDDAKRGKSSRGGRYNV